MTIDVAHPRSLSVGLSGWTFTMSSVWKSRLVAVAAMADV
jgi:hypothetical protein